MVSGSLTFACALAICCPLVQAADGPGKESEWGRSFFFNGYGTVGAAQVDANPNWGFARDIAQRSEQGTLKTGVDSRLGLQLNWKPSDDIEVVTQAGLRRQDGDQALQTSLDWAFVAWRPAAEWTLRAGRTSPDVFLLADYRNVGFAYPWVRPNVDTYGAVPFQSLDGLDLTRKWQSGEATWEAKISAGRSGMTFAPKAESGTQETSSKLKLHMWTAALSRECDGLTLKATYGQAIGSLSSTPQELALRNGLNQLGGAGIPGVSEQALALADALNFERFIGRYLGLAAQYEADAWQFVAEGGNYSVGHLSAGGRRGYVSIAYRLDSVTPFVMVGRSKAQRPAAAYPGQWGAALTPVLGASAAAAAVQLGTAGAFAYNASRLDQHSLSAGIRWDYSESAALKFQVDRFHIGAGGAGAWSHADAFTAGRATVISAVVDFVF